MAPGLSDRGFSFLCGQDCQARFFIILSENSHIIILEHAVGMIELNHAIRTSRYRRSVPGYSSYTRVKKGSNGGSVLARKIIIQSLICLAVVFSVVFLKSRTEDELPREIISSVRMFLVEKHVSTEELYRTVEDAYRECVDYIKGSD